MVREALERVLKSPTTAVFGAADPVVGLAFLGENAVDLAIVDVVLPGMDGVTAIKRIRQEHPAVRIIAMSGGGAFGLDGYCPESIVTSAYLSACKAAGADRVLTKPFETAELRGFIEQLRLS